MSTDVNHLSDAELDARHQRVPADYYHAGVRHNFLQRIWHAKRVPVVTAFVAGRSGRLLDLGCHGGYLTGIIARASGAAVTGVDISSDAIAYARQRYPDMSFLVRDLQQPLPFPDGSFQTATAFDVLEHVPKLGQTLSEIRRVLVADGRFILGVPRDTRLFRTVWRWWTKIRGTVWQDVHVHDFTGENLIAMANEHGFELVRQNISHWGMYLVMELRRRP